MLHFTTQVWRQLVQFHLKVHQAWLNFKAHYVWLNFEAHLAWLNFEAYLAWLTFKDSVYLISEVSNTQIREHLLKGKAQKSDHLIKVACFVKQIFLHY